ncbi:MAG: DinB family protein [Acidobacteriota bacterium]|nr:DinB family protein [Acidobacteriota bacterium]
MDRRGLAPAEGVSREIGFYLAGMDEVREQLREAVMGISDHDIGRLAVPDAHSIGTLVLHIGEAEWWWMQCRISKHELTDEDAQSPFWDVLKDPERVAHNGYSAEFCLAEADRIRAQTRDVLASFNDADLERAFAFERRGMSYERSLRWILHHLIDHEAQHKGQILMLERLLGLSNEGPFS